MAEQVIEHFESKNEVPVSSFNENQNAESKESQLNEFVSESKDNVENDKQPSTEVQVNSETGEMLFFFNRFDFFFKIFCLALIFFFFSRFCLLTYHLFLLSFFYIAIISINFYYFIILLFYCY